MLLVAAVAAATRLLTPPADWSAAGGEALQRCLSWLGPSVSVLTSPAEGPPAWPLRALHQGPAAVTLRSLPTQLSPFDRLQEARVDGSRSYFRMEETGYLVAGGDPQIVRLQLGREGPPLNPRARYLLLMQLEAALATLEELWIGRGALFALGLSNSSACRYDPFAVDAAGCYGAVACFSVDRSTDLTRVFSRSLSDLNGYELPVGTVLFNLYSYEWDNATQTGLGRDLLTLAHFSRSLNFRPAMRLLPDYGVRLASGVVTGALASTANAEVEIFLAARIVKWLGGGVEQVSPLVDSGRLLVVVPRAALLPLWQALAGALSARAWLAAAASYAAAVVAVRLAAALTGEPPVVGAWGPLLALAGAPWPGVSSAGRKVASALLLAGFLAGGLTLSALLQGAAFRAVAAPGRRHQLDSPRELDDSGLRVCPPSPGAADVFDNRDGAVWRSLSRKAWKCAGERGWQINGTMTEPNTALMVMDQQWRRRPPSYDELLHAMEGFSWSYQQTYTVPRGSVFLETFSRLTAQVVESGLANKWLDDRLDEVADNMLTLGDAQKAQLQLDTRERRPLTLAQMSAAAFVLAAGYLLSALVFLAELACNKFRINHRIKP